MKQKIFLMTAFHKNYFNIDSKDFVPIHVGKKLSNVDLGIVGDDTGDNISDKNKNFCELTALYWAWKNVDAEYYGLMHYRRYFLVEKSFIDNVKNDVRHLRKRIKTYLFLKYTYSYKFVKNISKPNIAYDEMNKLKNFLDTNIENYDIVLPEARLVRGTLLDDYAHCHITEDMHLVRDIISEKFPFYLGSFDRVMQSTKLYAYNMFIMKKDIFNEYMKWVFEILFALENKIDLDKRDVYQSRVFGFISERLLNVFVTNYQFNINQNVKIVELPIMFFKFE